MSSPGVSSVLWLPADLQVVAFVRCTFAAVLSREGWPAEGIGRLLLAASEALTNAIEHGSPAGGCVQVELAVSGERARMRIVDEGRPGVPVPRCPSRPPAPTSVRGRGLLIIRRLADEFSLRAAGGGTEVRAGFWRHPVEADAPAVVGGGRRAL